MAEHTRSAGDFPNRTMLPPTSRSTVLGDQKIEQERVREWSRAARAQEEPERDVADGADIAS